MKPTSAAADVRRRLMVRGLVQGVGFRPFVYALAHRLSLGGFVSNQLDGVKIEVEGSRRAIDLFTAALGVECPQLARIDDLRCEDLRLAGETDFRIHLSDRSAAAGEASIPPDLATCADCLRELFDPSDRRYRHAFITCTNCGPRLTIIRHAPYDRERTTMAMFAMCAACRAEYLDPTNRRFHAQAIACRDCGPSLLLRTPTGAAVGTGDPIEASVEALQAGRIVALKGLGGYHLACDARNEEAVARLRRCKQRDEKPLALMADLAMARSLCRLSRAEEALLGSPTRPIVLLSRHHGTAVAPSVAPDCGQLGLMLPYTPVHHLLLDRLQGAPLVMTSGNRSDEPIAFEEEDALSRLGDIADLFLTNDRPIHRRCDDSVSRVVGNKIAVLRRGRGLAPDSLQLPHACEATLAVGGHLKVVFAFGHGRRAVMSHHLGDLGDRRVFEDYLGAMASYESLLGIRPRLLVHDLHPDYASTQHAVERARVEGLPLLAVQHHHAHVVSCMAEHGLAGPVIGVAFDGLGYGSDGSLWGGELLVASYQRFSRVGHLRPVALPGGERAVREPWRVALAHLLEAGCPGGVDLITAGGVDRKAAHAVARMIDRGVQAPPTSSVGRLFDAVAVLAGARSQISFEGQAAMQLEWLAEGVAADGGYPLPIATEGDRLVLDPRPLIRAVVEERRRGVKPALVARRFHTTLAAAVATACVRIRSLVGIEDVVLTGGVFQNRILSEEAEALLSQAGFRVHRHERVPPNDGGLAFGQLAVAAARGASGPCA
jgi:hydrogenase maturation protein HypF